MELFFDDSPPSWKALQQLVGQLFSELGCKTEVEKRISTVRGSVEIDVYVEDLVVSPPLIYLYECKYWKRSVHKSVVHVFRTILADYGANRGYIISLSGF